MHARIMACGLFPLALLLEIFVCLPAELIKLGLISVSWLQLQSAHSSTLRFWSQGIPRLKHWPDGARYWVTLYPRMLFCFLAVSFFCQNGFHSGLSIRLSNTWRKELSSAFGLDSRCVFLLSAVIDTLHLEDLFLVPGISILAVILPANLHAGESVYLFV